MGNQLADLEVLFSNQIATLRDSGTPERIVELLEEQSDSILRKAGEMTFEDGHFPFLPVVPRTYRGPDDLMSAVHYGGEAGYVDLDPMAITDRVETPDVPYYIYDVENGKSTEGKSPEDAERIIESQKRSTLTAAEIIALVTHYNIVSWMDSVYGAGSQYGSAGDVVVVRLIEQISTNHVLYPILCSYPFAKVHSTLWKTPSLGSRG